MIWKVSKAESPKPQDQTFKKWEVVLQFGDFIFCIPLQCPPLEQEQCEGTAFTRGEELYKRGE
jgi:hypothetical protein